MKQVQDIRTQDRKAKLVLSGVNAEIKFMYFVEDQQVLLTGLSLVTHMLDKVCMFWLCNVLFSVYDIFPVILLSLSDLLFLLSSQATSSLKNYVLAGLCSPEILTLSLAFKHWLKCLLTFIFVLWLFQCSVCTIQTMPNTWNIPSKYLMSD